MTSVRRKTASAPVVITNVRYHVFPKSTVFTALRMPSAVLNEQPLYSTFDATFASRTVRVLDESVGECHFQYGGVRQHTSVLVAQVLVDSLLSFTD